MFDVSLSISEQSVKNDIKRFVSDTQEKIEIKSTKDTLTIKCYCNFKKFKDKDFKRIDNLLSMKENSIEKLSYVHHANYFIHKDHFEIYILFNIPIVLVKDTSFFPPRTSLF